MFIEFALLEDRLRSQLVKFGFEAMKLKFTKNNIFCICNPNPMLYMYVYNDFSYNPSLDPKGNQCLVQLDGSSNF